MPKKNGVVLIPFVGSGSECVIAKEMGLFYTGFELNPDYIRIAKRRLKETKPIQKLF
jgi:DNA modification methylase